MSPSPAQESEAILAAARASLADQRAGGRRGARERPGATHAPRRSIGRQSQALKARQVSRRLWWLAGGLVALMLASMVGGRADEQPAAAGVRQLVGEHLPSVVAAYTAIPAPLRGAAHAGTTPDEQLAASLTRISGEIDSVTRQLAEGALDSLAIHTRFLDYRYGEGTAAES